MFLGLDLSTQQLKGVVVDDKLRLLSETVVSFDNDLPHYGTRKGVYVRGKQVLSPVAMWVEALDLLMERMARGGAASSFQKVPLHAIRGICGSGQQHGSIYWTSKASDLLASLDHRRSLVDQLSRNGAFAYDLSPNWQDASTQEECDAIESCVGGPEKLAQLTGSKAHHRFTGPQVMRVRKTMPEVYHGTHRISLVSSFLCSLLLGRVAPIDSSDICGGNFWDVQGEQYVQEVLETISDGNAGTLREMLGEVCMDGATKLGPVAPYFREKYGFHADCQVVPFTGDNPATILALPLMKRDAMISLGTSTTMLLSTPYYVPSPAYHLFAHPTTKGYYMAMLCYKNGGLARESVRDSINEAHHNEQQGGGDPQLRDVWERFEALSLASGPPSRRGEHRKLGFYFPLPEIIPQTESGTWRFLVDSAGTPHPHDRFEGSGGRDHDSPWIVPDDDARAILDSQFLDIRMRSQPFFDPETRNPNSITKQPSRTYIVGGASRNHAIVQVVGEVLGSEEGIYRQLIGSSNACALGGANKAAWAISRTTAATVKESGQSFEDFVREHWVEGSSIEKIGNGYHAGVWEEYGDLLPAVECAEQMIVDKLV